MSEPAQTRVAVVTGAAQGIGEAIARRFAEEGYAVVYADVNLEGAERAAARFAESERALPVELDVRRLDSVQACLDAAVDRWGKVDVWVNNAARTLTAQFLEIDPEEWDDVLATNLRGTYFGCRVAGVHMLQRRAGRIVNLASLAGQWGRALTGAHYMASKAGIVSVTRSAAMALAPSVTVNAIAPAAIAGPAAAAMPAETLAAYVEDMPAGRLGQPEEVAAVALFLASPDAAFVTGATYDVNGGILMR